MIIALEGQAKLVVIDPQITVPALNDRLGIKLLHLLGHDADISLITAVVAEAIKAKAVIEIAEQDDVVLETDIGTPSPTTTARAASTASMSAAATACAVTGSASAGSHAAANSGVSSSSAPAVDGGSSAMGAPSALSAACVPSAAVRCSATWTRGRMVTAVSR